MVRVRRILIALVGGLGRDEGPGTLLAYPGYATLSASHTVSLTGLAAAVIALHPRLEINRLLFSSSTPAGRTLRTLLVPIGVIPLVAGVVAGNMDFTVAQARTAVWALFVGVGVLLATIVLVRSLAEMRREDDRLRLAEEADPVSAMARSGHVLEAMVDAADRLDRAAAGCCGRDVPGRFVSDPRRQRSVHDPLSAGAVTRPLRQTTRASQKTGVSR
jgi:hypothetical protein